MNNAVIAVSVCLCGGLGAAARYVCDSVIKASWHKAFPLSTFVINSIAGFLAGVIAGLYSRRFLSDPAHVMLATGFVGYVLTSVVVPVMAAALGYCLVV